MTESHVTPEAERAELTAEQEDWVVVALGVDPDLLEGAKEEGAITGSPPADTPPGPSGTDRGSHVPDQEDGSLDRIFAEPDIEARAREIIGLRHGPAAVERLVAHIERDIPPEQAAQLLAHLGADLSGFGIDFYRRMMAVTEAMESPMARFGAMSGLVKALPEFTDPGDATAVAELQDRLAAMMEGMPEPPHKAAAIAALILEPRALGPRMVKRALSTVQGMVGPGSLEGSKAMMGPMFQMVAMKSLSPFLGTLDPATLIEFSHLIRKLPPGDPAHVAAEAARQQGAAG